MAIHAADVGDDHGLVVLAAAFVRERDHCLARLAWRAVGEDLTKLVIVDLVADAVRAQQQAIAVAQLEPADRDTHVG